ncbi:hypothetical protein S101258_00098 [Lactiplantibacillus plantarum subsp. plantarum]|uniref:Uncharacterized protein n=1 Tax=Lactiplantibacillus plantarum subsp. plantarum TaxID=337330 RepID=A0A2S3U9Z5_LACPN|nr:hypothetical protein S101258_00098 [Lactiplantibacillus plantarum subsp. plantarum]
MVAGRAVKQNQSCLPLCFPQYTTRLTHGRAFPTGKSKAEPVLPHTFSIEPLSTINATLYSTTRLPRVPGKALSQQATIFDAVHFQLSQHSGQRLVRPWRTPIKRSGGKRTTAGPVLGAQACPEYRRDKGRSHPPINPSFGPDCPWFKNPTCAMKPDATGRNLAKRNVLIGDPRPFVPSTVLENFRRGIYVQKIIRTFKSQRRWNRFRNSCRPMKYGNPPIQSSLLA